MRSERDVNRFTANIFFTYLVASLITLGVYCIYLSDGVYRYVKGNITESNLVPYMLFIFVFLICSIVGLQLLKKLDAGALLNRLPQWGCVLVNVILTGLNLGLLLVCYMHEVDVFDAPVDKMMYHNIDKLVVAVLAIIFLAVFFLLGYVKETAEKDETIYKMIFWAVCIGLGLVYFYCLYTPNVYTADFNLYHNNAYYNSVFSALRGVPRSELNSGVYGYYGILIAPFVLILGGTTRAFYVVIGTFSVIALLSMDYVAYKLIHNKVVRYLVVVAYVLVVTSMHWSVYLQLIPHRIIFPSILMAFVVYINDRKKNRLIDQAVGYVICGLSIIWNFETGIICLFAYCCYFGLELLTKYRLVQLKLYLQILLRAFLAVLTFAGAFLFTGFVNICMGGYRLSIREFLFPMFNSSYMTGYLTVDYQHGVVAWLFVAGMAFMLLLYGLSRTTLNPLYIAKEREQTDRQGKLPEISVMIATLTLGMMAYYINRSAYGNLTIIYQMAVIMLGLIADQCIVRIRRREHRSAMFIGLYRGLSATFIMVLCGLILTGAYNFRSCQDARNESRYTDVSLIKEGEKRIKEVCKPDTRAMGLSIQGIYSDLGWDPYYYFIDFADLGVNPESFQYIQEELNDNLNEPILIDSVSLDLLEGQVDLTQFYSRFRVDQVIHIENTSIRYYVPVQE